MFYHSLINPRGDLADALKSTNILVFFGTTMAYVLVVFGIWLFYRSRGSKNKVKTLRKTGKFQKPEGDLQASSFIQMEATVPKMNKQQPHQNVAATYPEIDVFPPGGIKHCQGCGEEIKAEAKICRFCRERFEVHLRGYCLQDHQIVNVTDQGRCPFCGGVVEDIHVESKLTSVDTNTKGIRTPP
jgi:hypothetical protein